MVQAELLTGPSPLHSEQDIGSVLGQGKPGGDIGDERGLVACQFLFSPGPTAGGGLGMAGRTLSWALQRANVCLRASMVCGCRTVGQLGSIGGFRIVVLYPACRKGEVGRSGCGTSLLKFKGGMEGSFESPIFAPRQIECRSGQPRRLATMPIPEAPPLAGVSPSITRPGLPLPARSSGDRRHFSNKPLATGRRQDLHHEGTDETEASRLRIASLLRGMQDLKSAGHLASNPGFVRNFLLQRGSL